MLSGTTNLIAKLLERTDRAAQMEEVCELIAGELKAERVFVSYRDSSGDRLARFSVINKDPIVAPVLSGYSDELASTVWISDVERTRLPELILLQLKQAGVRSACVVELNFKQQNLGRLELHFCTGFHRFIAAEQLTLTSAGSVISSIIAREQAASSSQTSPAQTEESSPSKEDGSGEKTGESEGVLELIKAAPLHASSLERVLNFSGSLLLKTDPSFKISELVGDSEAFLGLSHNELIGHGFEALASRLFERDLKKLQRRLPKLSVRPIEFAQKIRFRRSDTNQDERAEVRSLVVRGVPEMVGEQVKAWTILCTDVTEQHKTRLQLLSQGKRIEALYEVSRAIQSSLEPSVVMFRALKAMVAATSGESGLGFSYDSVAESLELVASHGLSDNYVKGVEGKVNQRSLVRCAVETREAMLIPDIQNDSRAAVKLAEVEGLHGTIVTPLLVEGRVVGAIVLFSRQIAHFSQDDFELAKAASNQVALALQQAALYESERKQASSFAALYRLSHELSRRSSVEEISEQAFAILNEELALRRIWLGVLSDKAKLVLGQAGFGPGLRGKLVKSEIEIDKSDTALARAITSMRPQVIHPETRNEASGLGRLFERLSLSTYVIVPMVTLGQAVGVLVLEPIAPQGFFSPAKLSLLSGMANEIGVILLARRFEAKVAEADKMRMAGLLASGVAHNFNNILQALLGQASLIALQLPPHSPLQNSVALMREAAGRGADLVRQLLSYAQQGPQTIVSVSLTELLQHSLELYRSILGAGIKLETQFEADGAKVKADYGQLQQVVTNILINSREAIKRKDGVVKILLSRRVVTSTEIHPDLSPGRYLKLDISDNGIGMESEQRSRCFEPFFTTKSVDVVTGIGISGSGLGLSSAYSIVRQHNGVITVDSEPERGATFSVYLPEEQSAISAAVSQPLRGELLQAERLGVDQIKQIETKPHDKNGEPAQDISDPLALNADLIEKPEGTL